jgi:ABC-type Fe3+ transport system permease subunit
MAGVFRLISGFVIAAGFIVAWLAITWLVMLAALYLVRAIPLTTRRRRPEPEKDRAISKN